MKVNLGISESELVGDLTGEFIGAKCDNLFVLRSFISTFLFSKSDELLGEIIFNLLSFRLKEFF